MRFKSRVNCVCPLASETGFFKSVIGTDTLTEAQRQRLVSEVLVRRLTCYALLGVRRRRIRHGCQSGHRRGQEHLSDGRGGWHGARGHHPASMIVAGSRASQ